MDWIRSEKLGHGSFGTVNLAVNKNQSPLFPPLMAVKSCGAFLSSSLAKEKQILEELKGCPEIIKCYGDSFSDEKGERLYNVLLEYASNGDLARKVEHSDDQQLPENEVAQYTKALLKGLNYIHKFGYVHCDIKLQNILLASNGDLKISDFGLAKRAGEKKAGNSGFDLRGTPLYMSPESVMTGELESPADIWAVGCAVVEMITGAPVWNSSDDLDSSSGYSDLAGLLMRIGVGEDGPEIPANLSDEGKDFLGKCFLRNPSERWTAEMLLRHPFVCNGDDERDDASVSLKEKTESVSPKCPFDFLDWMGSDTCSITSPECSIDSGSWFSENSSDLVIQNGSNSAAARRLSGIVSDQGPDWSDSEDWITIR